MEGPRGGARLMDGDREAAQAQELAGEGAGPGQREGSAVLEACLATGRAAVLSSACS